MQHSPDGDDAYLSPTEKMRLWRALPAARHALSSDRDICIIAAAKRVFEWWTESSTFRESFSRQELESEIGVLAPEAYPLAGTAIGNSYGQEIEPDLRTAFLEHLTYLSSPKIIGDQGINCEAFQRWREAKRGLCLASATEEARRALSMVPFAFELGDGCSVGCYFCSVSAGGLKGHYVASKENLATFREILLVCQSLVGDALEHCPMYWATDPFDNPDYEEFAEVFCKVTGSDPPFCSALGTKNLHRTRQYLSSQHSRSLGRVRLSILSRKHLKFLYSEFSPTDLLSVDVAPVGRSSRLPKVVSGRFRTLFLHNANVQATELSSRQIIRGSDHGLLRAFEHWTLGESNSCLLGYRINFLNGKVSLCSPIQASEEFPNGEVIHASTLLEVGQDLSRELRRMIEIDPPLERLTGQGQRW